MQKFFFRYFLLILICFGSRSEVLSQDALKFNLKKPKKYENKKLASEKIDEKKFNGTRRFVQNTVTHYNWTFNASNKLNEVLERAKLMHQDDFSKLLPFYNYSLAITQSDSVQLDSIIYKTNTGVLIHDTRNAWIDNLFLLMGKAYFFQKNFDSAQVIFQYMNYAFAPKEKDGYDKVIASNANEGGNAMTVSTREKNSLLDKAFSTPPSRNESLIWQIKTALELEEYGLAAALIQTLKNDPNFPERLKPDLNEVQAHWFYRQNKYDSAAFYLEHALPNAENAMERSRWEYLIAQLYGLAGNHELAAAFYERAIKHTLDPVLEVNARLNAIRQTKGDSAITRKNLEALEKMARRDKYTRYRDLIYYSAAQIELERNNPEAARLLLMKAARYADPSVPGGQRTQAYLQLGDLAYAAGEYAEAKRFYDSLNLGDPLIPDPEAFAKRNEVLVQINDQLQILSRQDSLRRLAAMPEEEREVYVRKLLRQLRRSQGLKEEETSSAAAPVLKPNEIATVDLFESEAKGDWYFYNQSLKSKGFTIFKGKWGNRPNVDNWRRSNAISITSTNPGMPNPNVPGMAPPVESLAADLSYDGLIKNIPLTPEQLQVSADSVQNAEVELGRLYLEGLQAYKPVIQTLDSFSLEYPKSPRLPEALYYLYYSYLQMGQRANADMVLAELQRGYAGNRYERMISDAVNRNQPNNPEVAMTTRYNSSYNSFIEGKFERALAEKKEADSLYGNSYWTPQLLYIESIYHIRQRNDTLAMASLQNIVSLYPNTPMQEKAQTMIDVLSRRKEIEEYLTNLQIERPAEDSAVVITEPTPPPVVKQEEIAKQPEPKQDTVAVVEKPKPVVEEKDPEVKETRQPTPATVKPGVPVTTAPVLVRRDSAVANRTAPLATTYSYAPEVPHTVVIVLNNVDPVYVTESRNAFNRYNQEKYAGKKIEIVNEALTDTIRLVVMNGFVNAQEAMDYMQKTAPISAGQIVPWLPAAKYRFMVISQENLGILRNLKSMEQYRRFMDQYYK